MRIARVFVCLRITIAHIGVCTNVHLNVYILRKWITGKLKYRNTFLHISMFVLSWVLSEFMQKPCTRTLNVCLKQRTLG